MILLNNNPWENLQESDIYEDALEGALEDPSIQTEQENDIFEDALEDPSIQTERDNHTIHGEEREELWDMKKALSESYVRLVN